MALFKKHGLGVRRLLGLFVLVAIFDFAAVITGAAADNPTERGLRGSLDPTQTLSQSELDAMRSRLAKLWKITPSVDHPEQQFVTVRVRLNRDRRLAAPPEIVSSGNSAQYRAAANAAIQAVLKGQPFTMLRDETYDDWKYMDIDFDPGQFAHIGK